MSLYRHPVEQMTLYQALREAVIRHCPGCGTERPPTGGAFCSSACESKERREQMDDLRRRAGTAITMMRARDFNDTADLIEELLAYVR